MAMCFFALTASAQLKVSSTGKVSVGTTSASSSALSVNSTGNSNYAAYINGNTKVDGGYLKADVYNPTQSTTGNNNTMLKAVACLYQLTPVPYTQSSRSDSGNTDDAYETDEEGRLVVTPHV